jgi:hypothetical protein
MRKYCDPPECYNSPHPSGVFLFQGKSKKMIAKTVPVAQFQALTS